jgi:hypothetical protein
VALAQASKCQGGAMEAKTTGAALLHQKLKKKNKITTVYYRLLRLLPPTTIFYRLLRFSKFKIKHILLKKQKKKLIENRVNHKEFLNKAHSYWNIGIII